jgi:hypothetical protein
VSSPEAGQVLLDRALPEYQFHEVHSTEVRAPGAKVFEAVRSVSPDELPLFRLLMGVRGLPGALWRRPSPWRSAQSSLLDRALAAGFAVLGEDDDREVVLGLVAQPWRVFGARVAPTPPSLEAFADLRTPGYAKVATNFLLDAEPSGDGAKRLRTETRVWLPDLPTTIRFGAYWTLIRPGSGVIRREWLERIKARSEQGA